MLNTTEKAGLLDNNREKITAVRDDSSAGVGGAGVNMSLHGSHVDYGYNTHSAHSHSVGGGSGRGVGSVIGGLGGVTGVTGGGLGISADVDESNMMNR